MIRRPPRSTLSSSSAASDVYKRQGKKKVASAPPPPPPPAPTASLIANPNTIHAGQASTLTWKTDYATDVTIDQLGKVDPSGSREVIPAESTTYHLVAKNDSGTQEATERITVVGPPPPPPQQTSNGTDGQLFSENMKDVFYDYDSLRDGIPIRLGPLSHRSGLHGLVAKQPGFQFLFAQALRQRPTDPGCYRPFQILVDRAQPHSATACDLALPQP